MDSDLYKDIHYISSLQDATAEDLKLLIRSYPIVDNHAHNMLREEFACDSPEYAFETITSEAQGQALHEHVSASLAHIRGMNQLADMFRCEPKLDIVKAVRNERVRNDYTGLIRTCLGGTHAILMDDGLAPEAVHPYAWHRQFVPTVSRIVRIEFLAAELLEKLVADADLQQPGLDAVWNPSKSASLLLQFDAQFRTQITTLAQDPNVCGFKSVVCYRTGLDVGLGSRGAFEKPQSLDSLALSTSFHQFLQRSVQGSNYRVEQKEVNDYLVVAVCEILEQLALDKGRNLPIQFHTGLGDSDIDLVKANPAYMQPLITAFPHVDFVMLHASYPYTREAGYLATVFANAWLDVGLIFPSLSRDGQEQALRHALELSPTSKILWSTDGHLHPETYYLSNCQFRAVLEKVLVEYVQAGDLSAAQAIDAAVDILFWNSNKLYRLNEERKYPQLLQACGRSQGASLQTSSKSSTEAASRLPAAEPANLGIHRSVKISANTNVMASAVDDNLAAFDAFYAQNPFIKYIWVVSVDYTGTPRLRMIPVAAFKKHLSTKKYPGITSALPRLIQNDTQPAGGSATGEIKMVPDMSSIQLNAGIGSPSATVQVWWKKDIGTGQLEHDWGCPRWALQKHLDALRDEFNLTMLMGFEVEIIFMRPNLTEDKSSFAEFVPLNTVHSWSNLTYQDTETLPMIEEIVEILASIGIELDQFHCEAAPGQWEFPLPCYEPLKSIDVLYKTREVIRWVAQKHGLKATVYPRPFNFTCGSACHAHFSINGTPDLVERYSAPFLAGILLNLPSVLAFSLPIEESYSRINAGIWAGGEYVCWGTQNRETPLRKCGLGHWELKTNDGIGNTYLAMAALVASGLYGLRENLPLTHKDNVDDPSLLTKSQRKALGITTLLPKTLSESLGSLEQNKVLKRYLGEELVKTYVQVKRHEMETLNGMEEKERKVWLIARY